MCVYPFMSLKSISKIIIYDNLFTYDDGLDFFRWIIHMGIAMWKIKILQYCSTTYCLRSRPGDRDVVCVCVRQFVVMLKL